MRAIAPLGTYIAVQMLTQLGVAHYVPSSRLHQLVTDGGEVALIGSVAVAALCVYVLVDLLYSLAVAPQRKRLMGRAGTRRGGTAARILLRIEDAFGRARLYAWMLLGIGQASLFFIAGRVEMPLLVALQFLWAALWCVVVALLDFTGPRRAQLARYRGA